MRVLLVVLALALVLPEALAGAGAGEKKAQLCVLCHRTNTLYGAGIPLLEGRPAEEIAAAVMEFKTGKRNSPAMNPNVERLSKRDIADIAAWFAAQPAQWHAVPVPADTGEKLSAL